MTDLIDRNNYPQLNLILWDDHNRFIEPEQALKYYEARWRYVEHTQLQQNEAELIQKLADRFGNGLLLTA